MSNESPPPDPAPGNDHDSSERRGSRPTFTMDCTDRLTIIGSGFDGTVDPPIPAPARPRLEWNHIAEKRLFALTHDGETEYWRDNPTRYLVVEPDFNTGEMQPVLKGRRPVYLWLCREEREPR
jgi:hypothetical protein